jgi:hypothetical protein
VKGVKGFKRAPTASDNQPAPEAETGFSFFGNDIESEDEPQMAEPQTPFTPESSLGFGCWLVIGCCRGPFEKSFKRVDFLGR